jgi:hypothetical protein
VIFPSTSVRSAPRLVEPFTTRRSTAAADPILAGVMRLYATNWGERVLILGGDGFLGHVTPPACRSTRSR